MFFPRTYKGEYDYYHYLVSIVEAAGIYLVVKVYYIDENCSKHLLNDPDLEPEIWEFIEQQRAEEHYERITKS